MKIAQLVHHFADSLGGLEICAHNVSQRLALAGDDVSLYCCDPHRLAFVPPYTVRPFIKLYKVRQTYPLSKLLAWAYVWREQSRHRYDLWQVNGGYPYGAYLIGLFRRMKVPAVLRCSGEDIQADRVLGYGFRLDPSLARLIDAAYPRYDALVAITQTVKNEYLAMGVPEENIALIPNGADVDRIRRFPADEAVRARHGIPLDARVILTVGRNHPKKNYRIIPGILAALLESGRNVWWIVAGEGCGALDRAGLPKRWRERLVRVERIGPPALDHNLPSDELLAYYKAADAFAMTSLLETFGIVIIEALAAGLPVAAFDVPGVRHVALPGVASLVPAGDASAMASALAGAMDGLDSPRAAAERARREEYAAGHSWDRTAGAYRALYAKLVERGGRAAGGR
jgi:glycosyltransferase involved in cell wall biosynthesis